MGRKGHLGTQQSRLSFFGLLWKVLFSFSKWSLCNAQQTLEECAIPVTYAEAFSSNFIFYDNKRLGETRVGQHRCICEITDQPHNTGLLRLAAVCTAAV